MAEPISDADALELHHYIVVGGDHAAADATRALRGEGFVVEPAARPGDWLITARAPDSGYDLASAERLMLRTAESFGGTYEGSEIVRRT